MIDRFFLWLGAGVVAAGVTVGMLAGAGAANAHTESDGDGGVKTSQAAKSSENKPDSGKNERAGSAAKQNANDDKSGVDDDPDAKVDRGVVKEDEAEQSSRKTPKSEVGKRTAKLINNFVAAVTPKPARKVVVEKADPVEKVDPVETVDPVDDRRNRGDRHRTGRTGTAQGRTPADAGDRADRLQAHQGAAHGNGHHAGDADAGPLGERRLGGSTDSGAAGGQRHRHRRLRPDLIRRERVRGTAVGSAGKRSHRQAVHLGHRRRP